MSRSVSLALAVALLAGCGGGPDGGPPDILYGQDICDRCRMVISEERHAAGFRHEGRVYRFDDAGCLLGLLDSGEESASGIAWVHDENGAWLPAEEAWFVIDPEGGTPMASGILAFGSPEAAAAAASGYGVGPQRWPEIAASAEVSGR